MTLPPLEEDKGGVAVENACVTNRKLFLHEPERTDREGPEAKRDTVGLPVLPPW